MILSNKLKNFFRKLRKPIKGVATSLWHHEDLCNSKWNEDDADYMGSNRFHREGIDLAAKSLKSPNGPNPFAKKGLDWSPFALQQQEAIGFAFGYYATQTGAASIYYAASFNAATTYPAGNGKLALATSYVQFNGIIYSIPGTVASTPGTPPPGGVWVVAQPNAPQWVGANPSYRQSGTFTIPTGDFPQPVAGTVLTPDSTWAIPESQQLAGVVTYRYLPAPGIGFITSSATFGVIQLNIAGTFTSVSPLVTFVAGVSGWNWFCTDGLTLQLLSGATLNNIVYYRIQQLIMS